MSCKRAGLVDVLRLCLPVHSLRCSALHTDGKNQYCILQSNLADNKNLLYWCKLIYIQIENKIIELNMSKFYRTSFHRISFICQLHMCMYNKFSVTSFGFLTPGSHY